MQKKRTYENAYETITHSFVAGNGTTFDPHTYSFAEPNPKVGSWQYRLMQTDLDGSIHFSDSLRLEITTDIASNNAPESYTLSQNYPNPFNPSTEIRLCVAKSGFASIIVYDILGREITSLYSGIAEPGKQLSVTFDGRNREGNPVASGVCFYRLHLFNESSSTLLPPVKRMVIVR